MDKSSYEFSGLSEAQLDAVVSRAHQIRAEAIADAFIWTGRALHALLIKPFSLLTRRTPPRNALPR